MSDPVNRILSALREHGHTPKRSGEGWSCRCPAHDDRNPSLSIGTGDNGKVLVKCQRGCDTSDVLRAIGLKWSDLFADDPTRRNGHAPKPRRRCDGDETPASGIATAGFVASRRPEPKPRTFPTAREAMAYIEARLGPRSESWTYHNAGGEPVGVVARWNTPTGKTIRPVSRLPDGSGWCIGGMPEPRRLYGLPELLATPAGARVWVCEGEKAADAARAAGLVATTSPHGAKSANKADWSPMAGRDVVILPDHDDAGEKYAEDVARLASAAGAVSVRVVRLVELWAGMPEGGDMADLVEHRAGDADAIRAEIEALADASEPEDSAGLTVPAPALAPTLDLAEVFPERLSELREFLAALSEATQTPPEMAAMLALSIASACCAGVVEIDGGGWVEPAPLWTLVLAPSGSRKSAVFRALTAPVNAWEREEAERLAPFIADAVRDRAFAEDRYDALRRKAVSAKPDQYKAAKHDADAAAAELETLPDVPQAPRLVISDATPEALVRHLARHGGRALVADPEADVLRTTTGRRYGESPAWGTLLKAHAGDAIHEDRMGRESVHVPRPAAALAVVAQPEAVEELWANADARTNGFLARFLVSRPPDNLGFRKIETPPVPERLARAWDRLIRGLLEHAPRDTPATVRLDPEAGTLFVAFRREVEPAMRPGGEHYERRAWASKFPGAVLRIAGVLHALATWAVRGTPDDAGPIDGATMRAALAWGRFAADAERHAREGLTASPEDRERAALVEWIESKGGTATVRDLTRGPSAFRGDPERAAKALGELVASSVAAWVQDGDGAKGGRPAKRVRLVSQRGDAAPCDETPTGGIAAGGFVAVASEATAENGALPAGWSGLL
ncbi:MAG: DUF3987 domain-containing protein [Phycisphaerales bacterium]|nr:MAG: DUF3987 domain-containing protein [Phycisphaerales bacterium]